MVTRQEIQQFMEDPVYKPMTKEDLVLQFDLPISEFRAFFELLKQMEKESVLIRTKKDKYMLLKDNNNYIKGEIQRHEKGFGFVIPDDKNEDDIYLSPDNLKNLMHKDKVIVRKLSGGKGNRTEGEIVRILERSKETIVGTFHKEKNFGVVVADDKRAYFDIFIPKGKINGAKDDDKVVVELEGYPTQKKNPQGRIIQVLGNKNAIGIDVLSIIYQHELPIEFPEEVLKQADYISFDLPKEELDYREDFSDLFTVTIDGATAKDFDDAISIEKEKDSYILYVHIADVSYYVHENSPMDKEAIKRGNSVYLLDRVLPMLPEKLSNGVCSLLPGEIRLAKTVKMKISFDGEVKDYRFYESIIRSDHRLIYDEVSDFLEEKKNVYQDHILEQHLNWMDELAKILKQKRQARGALDFEFPESEIIVDNKGIPIDIKRSERRIADKIIEEFMIVTNETVGSHYKHLQAPFIFRIHEAPSDEKIEDFSHFLHIFGYSLKGDGKHPREYQRILDESRGKNEETLIHTLLLKSMQKARYTDYADIHFGLATKDYCHFTAPIRRYSDLFVHRIMHEDLVHPGRFSKDKKHNKIQALAEHISKTELKAEYTERDVEDLKKAQYMEHRIGEVFEGTVSSLNNFGFFVQLENTIEGLVHFKNLNDYYYFDESTYQIKGETNGKIIALGDRVTVELIDVSVLERTIDFKWIEEKK